MSTRDLLLEGVEQAINKLLAMDPTSSAQLAQYHGKVIALHLRGLELTLYFVPDQQGHLQLLGNIEGEADATLSGSPLDLLQSRDAESGAAQLFGGKVSLQGDSHLAKNFGAILGNLDIDWEEQLSHISGDIIAHKTGRAVRQGLSWAEDERSTLQQNLGEYLTEEAQLLPHPYEMEEFINGVDEVRDQSERLFARLQRLEHQA